MANNKVQLADGTTLIDLTEDTVTPQSLIFGATAHNASGETITGEVITTELPFMIVKQPESAEFSTVGQRVTFEVVLAGGSGEYTYQWQLYSGGTWTDLTGSTTRTLTLGADRNVGFRCVVSDGVTTLYTNLVYCYLANEGVKNLEYAVNGGNYGVCFTAADVQVKEVTIPGAFVATGTTIHVSFQYANTASQPKLSLNGSPSKYMALYGSTAFGSVASTNGWQAGAVVSLTYNGTYWIRDQGYNTNTSYTDATQSQHGLMSVEDKIKLDAISNLATLEFEVVE